MNRIGLIALAVLLMACGGQNQEEKEEMSYDLLTVETQDHQVEVAYAAQIRGAQDIRIIPRVEGYLEETKVKEGSRVKKGQLLFLIDQVAYKAALRTAEANVQQAQALLAKAEQEYQGKQQLHAAQVVLDFDLAQTQRDLEVAKANLAAALATQEAARNELSFTELRSPSDGVIGRLPYRKGDLVGPSTTEGLTVVSDNHQMHVYFSMTESQVMDFLTAYPSMQEAIHHFPKVSLLLPDGKPYDEQGWVESVSGIVDEQTGAVSVRAVFPNAGERLLSGGTARVLLPHVYKEAILIPQEATFEIQDKVFVYKVKEGKAVSEMIEVIRLHDGQHFVVTKGLAKGDVIIAKGAGLVKEGTNIINSK